MADERQETYTHGYHRSVLAQHAGRTVEESAAFFVPHLRPGMRLLDVGCGPGSITVGLAKAVAPGQVTGIDASERVIDQAGDRAREDGVANVSFQAANIYDAPFDEATFDAVFAHQVLQHLARPVDALRQAHRVLKPGGFLGVREVDWGTVAIIPFGPHIERFLQIYRAVAIRNGGQPDAGRHVREWLAAAGFADVTITTSTWTFADSESTAAYGESWAERIVDSSIPEKAMEYGLTDRAELEEIAAGWREWGDDPNAFFAFTHVEGVGWKR